MKNATRRRVRQGSALCLAAVAAAAVCAPSAGATSATTSTTAPSVRMLATDGQVTVDCGALPTGATQFRITYKRSGSSASTTALAAGTTAGNVTLKRGYAYAITCASKSSGGWSAESAAASADYPDFDLPVLWINTQNSATVTSRQQWVGATVTLDPHGDKKVAGFTVAAQIRGRGSSSWDAPTDKKPYRLKLSQKEPVLGMDSDKSWALTTNYYDRTSLRNALAYHWGRHSSLAWTPDDKFAEVVLNGDYRGLYLVSDLIEAAGGRVNIDKMTSSDTSGATVTGGYIAELDFKAESPWKQPDDVVDFHTALTGAPFTIHEPDSPNATQVAYLKSYMDQVEAAVMATTPTGSLAPVNALLDTQSLADWFIISELARNFDSWYSSTYFYKPRGGRLTAGPLWDFDMSMGTYFLASQPYNDPWVSVRSPWLATLLKNQQFQALVKARYKAMKPLFEKSDDYLSDVNKDIKDDRANDAVRWGYTDNLSKQVDALESWVDHRRSWFEKYYAVK